MKCNYNIWNLEKFKVNEPNDYQNIIDSSLRFDYKNRECAIANLFRTTKDPNVKQVLRFAMELNNQYRTEAMKLYNTLFEINKKCKMIRKLTNDTLNDVYL